MSDSPGPGGSAPSDDGDATNPGIALGVVFAMLGVTLILVLEETRVAGLPFLILGVTMFVIALLAKRPAPTGPEPGNDHGPGAPPR